MNRSGLHIFRHACMVLLLIFIGYADLLYKLLFEHYYNPYISYGLVAIALSVLISLYHIWYIAPYNSLLNIIEKYYCDVVDEAAVSSAQKSRITYSSVAEKVPNVTLEKIVQHYKQHNHEQAVLVDKLKCANQLLEKNSRFANAIVEITSTILRSGDIHSILQLILDKAIEIIPNAQKGSILLFNGNYLEYKAMHGYNIEALKDFRFTVEEVFQYNAKDLYTPIIIPDVEKFNKNLKTDKFATLKESRSFELKACISCAISLDNQFYGIINIDNVDDNYAFSEEHKPIIKYFAEQIGVALKNAQLLERTLYLSRYDGLTGICNRAYFEEQLESIYKHAEDKNESFCLVSFDLNYLKSVNDDYGHEAGDMLIVAFTKYLASIEEKPDIFGRIGGDEFAMVYLRKNKQEVSDLIKEIARHFKEVPFNYNGLDLLSITFGYGISCYPEDATDIPSLFRLADKLMYSEKKRLKDEMKQ